MCLKKPLGSLTAKHQKYININEKINLFSE